MRIYGPNGTTPASSTSNTRRSSSSSFSLPTSSETGDSRPAAAPVGVSGIDALLALQGVEDPTERRKRAVKRGRDALDVLDDLKLGLLAGSLDPATVQRTVATITTTFRDMARSRSVLPARRNPAVVRPSCGVRGSKRATWDDGDFLNQSHRSKRAVTCVGCVKSR